MATRFSFAIMGQSSSELISGLGIEVKDGNGTIKASTTPTAGQLLVTDNNDGTYYVDGLSTGKYDVFTEGVVQNELKNVPFVSDAGITKIDSALTTTDLKTTAVNDASVVWSGSILHSTFATKETTDASNPHLKKNDLSDSVVSDSSVLPASQKAVKDAREDCVLLTNIVDALDSTDATKVLSAKQGKALNDTITGLNTMATLSSTAPATINADDFVLNGTELKIRQSNLTSQNYVNGGQSLFQNISAIDQRLGFLTANDSGEGTWTVLWANDNYQTRNNSTGLLGTETSLIQSFKLEEPTHTAGSTNYYPIFAMSLFKIPSIRELVFYYKGKVDADSQGKVKLTCHTLSKEGADVTDSADFTDLRGLYLDISGLPNYQVYDIKVEMKIHDADAGGGNQSFEIKNTMLVGKYQITAAEQEQNNPSA